VAYAVFGLRVDGDALLRDGDRVELLRPLLADPKEARRQRVEDRRRSSKK
jgi:putative ubiquitin-RnfH superfamily antitoxin RatB of RatAB toxin-antitoxin module